MRMKSLVAAVAGLTVALASASQVAETFSPEADANLSAASLFEQIITPPE